VLDQIVDEIVESRITKSENLEKKSKKRKKKKDKKLRHSSDSSLEEDNLDPN